MQILSQAITLTAIQSKHSRFFSKMVKIVVDLARNKLALDAELHADLEALLLEDGSQQEDLWGANIYFEGPVYLEFNSLINIRPHQNNPSMDVLDPELQKKISAMVDHWIIK